MSQLQQLYQLQQIDTEFRQKKQRLAEVLRAQKETEAVVTARRAAEAAAAELQQWQAARKGLNQELEALNAKAKRSEQRLYSGKVNNPKELSDLQQEIDALGRRRSGLEDEMLEAMIHVEEAEAVRETAVATLSDVESKWRTTQAGLQEEQHVLALRLHELNELRKQQAAAVSPANLRTYTQLLQRMHGLAVAELKQNMCLGCRLTVSAQAVKQANEGQLATCGTCGRILFPV
ncbi:MAG: hypothetical protein KC425_13725 [Anaerolineales bacterium]|nr:hypothetical protein [Anaerolineales bacterium]